MTIGIFGTPAGRVRLRTPGGWLPPVVPGQATADGSAPAPPPDPDPTPPPAPTVLALFAPEAATWEWRELPDGDGAVAATYPYPPAPSAGADGPYLLTEASVVTGNATGLGPSGSAYSWSVERQGTQPAITTGPLLRARTTGAGTPLAVTLTITPPSGAPIVHTRQVTCLTMDSGRGRHQADVGGIARTIDARFTAPVAGEYRVLWEQLDDHGQLLPRAERLSMVTLTAGQQHTAAVTVTPPAVTALRTYAWRAVIEDPDGGVHVGHAVYDAVHPAAVTSPVGDDRLPVPAGPLAQMVHTFPLQAPGDDEDNADMTQAQAATAFTGQILTGGMVLDCTGTGIPVHVAALGPADRVPVPPIDTQAKMAPDWGWIGWEQLVAPRVSPTGATQATGSDATIGFYDPATGVYVENWKATVDEKLRWRAAQGGRTDLHTTDGRWERPGAGVSAAGLLQGPAVLSLYAVQACIARIQAGRGFDDLITHALLVALPQVRGFVGGTRRYVHPAIKSDGTGPSSAPLMGARFRLAPTVDMTGWSPLARVIGRWLQLAGCVVSDTTGGGAAIICRAYPERMMGGQPNPWDAVFPEGRGWSSALPEIGRAAAWQALKPGHVGTAPTAPVMPPPIEITPPDPDPEPDPEHPVLLADEFARTVASGWGDAESGGAWTTWGTGRSVDGSRGVLTGAPGSGMGAVHPATSEDQQLDLVFTLPTKPTVSTYLGVSQRKIGTDRVLTNLNFRPDGTIFIQQRADLAKDVYFTAGATGITSWAAGDRLRLRSTVLTSVEPDGTTRRVTASSWLWRDGDPMPDAPTVTGSSAAAGVQVLAAAGTSDVDVYVPAGEPSALTLAVDSWRIVDPTRVVGEETPSDGTTETVVVDGAHVTITDLLSA